MPALTSEVDPTHQATQETARPLRRDAVRNRELILQTAGEVFAEHGLDAGYDEIARRAGVGVGTVYRRFPDRAELVQALFESRIEEIVVLAETAAARPSAWEGLTWFLDAVARQQVADRGLQEVLWQTVDDVVHLTVGRERLSPVIEDLISRAKAEGRLRGDVQPTDVGVLLMVMGSLTTPDRPDLWRRYLTMLLDGLRADPDNTPLGIDAPQDEDLHDLMRARHSR
jgi:AcrR family transcriptional regulator